MIGHSTSSIVVTTLARRWPSFRSAVAMSGLIALVAACQPGPSGSPGIGSPEPRVSPSPSLAAAPLASASPSVSPAASSSPSPIPSPASVWERTIVQTGLDAPLTRVVWTGTRFLAVDGVDGTLLDSTDGRTWHGQPRLADGYVDQVVAGPQGLLAVGSVNAEGVVAIWRSVDGLSWSGTPDAPSLHSRNGAFITMASVVAAGTGWLAVGGETLNCIPGACRLVRAVTWTSPDGLRWTRRADAAAMQHAEMTGVVRTPSGYAAVGDAAADPSRPGSAIRPAVWTSPDGRTWTRSGRLPVVKAANDANVVLDGVAATGSRVVAVGYVGTQGGGSAQAFAWRSDGGPWSSIKIGQFNPSQPVRVVAVSGGFLAMFGFGSGAACSSAAWSSADGSSWSCLGNDSAFAGSAVSDAASAPMLDVLVGYGPDGAIVWTSTQP